MIWYCWLILVLKLSHAAGNLVLRDAGRKNLADIAVNKD